MAQIEKLFEFCNAQSMPNATTVVSDFVINMVENLGWAAKNRPMWIVVTVNTVPSAGTSCNVFLYRHTSAAVGSGKLLMTSEVVAIADMSANPRATGGKHILAVFPWPLRSDRDADETDQTEYFGLVLNGAGDVSSGKVDAYVSIDSPLIHTTMRVESNI